MVVLSILTTILGIADLKLMLEKESTLYLSVRGATFLSSLAPKVCPIQLAYANCIGQGGCCCSPTGFRGATTG